MLRLYDYAASANCYKVRLLLAQLGRDYERVSVDIFPGDTLTDQYAAINPARSTPVLEVDGEYLAESNAILVFLAEGTEFTPDGSLDRARVIGLLIFEQTEVMATMGGLRFRLLTKRLSPQGVEARSRGERAIRTLPLLDGHLGRRDFLVGDRYSIADTAMFGYTHVADEAGLDLSRYPAVLRWLDRVRSQSGHVNDLEPCPENARREVDARSMTRAGGQGPSSA